VFLKFSVVIAACSMLKVCARKIATSEVSSSAYEREEEGARGGRGGEVWD